MPYPGEMALCPTCCSGPCMCIPNARYWGHFTRQWTPWPGHELRADVRFPEDRGIEHIVAPPGVLPKVLPKEEYAPPEAETGPGVRIQQGPPSGQVPTTPLPFQEFGLPGLDLPPQSTLPETPPPAESVPKTEQAPIPSLPGMDSTYVIPPAPMPRQTKWIPTTPGALPEVSSPNAPIATVSRPNGPFTQPSPTLAPAESSLDLAPLPEVVPPGLVLPTTLVGQSSSMPAESLGSVPAEAPMPPASVVNMGGAPMLMPALGSAGGTAPPARPEPLNASAPLPDAPAPPTPGPSPTNDSLATDKPWVEPGEWKSRRAASERSEALSVEFQQPAHVPSVGLDGYCPVELVRHEQWVDGNPQLAVEHEGQTYFLSGPQQQRLFRANPERYAPVLAGRDPVLAATSGDLVPGRTEMCVVYDGRLFMFSSKATLAAFNDDPERFTAELEKPARSK
ncbi:MAG TPA: hypothetical protein DD670_04650 [Planctomycetaceae bacterium]|nr:hypothetical protein [Planctomycetaceae bacterium]